VQLCILIINTNHETNAMQILHIASCGGGFWLYAMR